MFAAQAIKAVEIGVGGLQNKWHVVAGAVKTDADPLRGRLWRMISGEVAAAIALADQVPRPIILQ